MGVGYCMSVLAKAQFFGSAEEKIPHERNMSKASERAWRREIADIYARMRARAKSGPYEIDFDGKPYLVFPDVYAPQFFTDSFWFARVLPAIVGDGTLLEIGPGTGIIGINCALKGADVVMSDINPAAAANTELNAKSLSAQVSVRCGDLYQEIKAEERFDHIFWAHPFNNWPHPVYNALLRSGLDYQYRGVRAYLLEGMKFLRPGGQILLGTGNSADLDTILHTSEIASYAYEIVARESLPLQYGGQAEIEYLVYRFWPR